jgi:hypothetical protein
LLVCGCSAERGDPTGVYLAGEKRTEHHTDVVYWKDGQEVQLHSVDVRTCDPCGQTRANAVTVKDGVVYVAGTYLQNLYYWRDGAETQLARTSRPPEIRTDTSDVRSIFVDGSDVYLAGWELQCQDKYCSTAQDAARYWKNGEVHKLPSTGSSRAYGIIVVGGTVVVAGYDGDQACYWHDGKQRLMKNPDHKSCSLRAVQADGGTLYFAQNCNGPESYYWAGDKRHELTPVTKNAPKTPYTYVTSIYVRAGAVYATGTTEVYGAVKGAVKELHKQACLWKDGRPVLLSDRGSYSRPESVFVGSTGVIHVGGSVGLAKEVTWKGIACHWKDGERIEVTDPETSHSFGYAIFVQE